MSIHVPQAKEQVFFYKLAESTQLFLVQVYELAGRQVTQWSEAVAELKNWQFRKWCLERY